MRYINLHFTYFTYLLTVISRRSNSSSSIITNNYEYWSAGQIICLAGIINNNNS